MGRLSFYDIVVICVYLVFVMIVGITKSKKVLGINDYAFGDRNFSTFSIVATLFATYIDIGTTVGDIEGVYSMGLIYAIPLLASSLLWFVTRLIFITNIESFRGCFSIVDILEMSYGKIGRYVSLCHVLFCSFLVLSLQITGIAYMFHYFLGISYFAGSMLGIGIVLIYSVFGGIRAVIVTDIIQFLIFFFILPIICGYAYFKVGGYANIVNNLPMSHKMLPTNKAELAMFLSLLFYALLPTTGPVYIHRLLIAKNKAQLKEAFNVLPFCNIVIVVSLCVIGFIIGSLYKGIDGRLCFYIFTDTFMSSGMKGLILVGILAIAQSTADSYINTSSAIVTKNVISSIWKGLSDKRLLFIARTSACIITLVAMVIALISKEILKMLFLLNCFSLSLTFVPMAAGFLKFKTSATTLVLSMVFALLGACYGKFYSGEFGVISTATGVIGSAIGFFAVHYCQKGFCILK